MPTATAEQAVAGEHQSGGAEFARVTVAGKARSASTRSTMPPTITSAQDLAEANRLLLRFPPGPRPRPQHIDSANLAGDYSAREVAGGGRTGAQKLTRAFDDESRRQAAPPSTMTRLIGEREKHPARYRLCQR